MSGSGLFVKESPVVPHLNKNEIADLRADVGRVFKPMAALTVEEWTDSAAGTAAALLAAAATVASIVTVSSFLAPGVAILAAGARNLTFTTAGGTAADAPANAVITGTDANGAQQTETVALAQTGTIASGVKCFKTVTKVVYPAADGTGATVSIGIGNLLGLTKTPKARAGLAKAVMEIAAGAVVTTGTLDATNKTYAPAAAPDGAKDYAVFYEYVP